MGSEGPFVGRQQPSTEAAATANHSNDILIRLNGQDRKVRAGTTVGGLLAELGLPRDRVAVEVDREIIRRREWESRQLNPGVAVEIVHFVGGG
jgi:thiamine biosynthesis protein ThiS